MHRVVSNMTGTFSSRELEITSEASLLSIVERSEIAYVLSSLPDGEPWTFSPSEALEANLDAFLHSDPRWHSRARNTFCNHFRSTFLMTSAGMYRSGIDLVWVICIN